MTVRRGGFGDGVRAMLAILPGVAPFGTIYGVLAIDAGLSPAAAQAMSAIVFAGSSQFIATSLFAGGSPLVILVLTTFIVNLRHALYSASVAPYVARLPWRWKVPLAYLLTDEAYAVAIQRFRTPVRDGDAPPYQYYLGAALALWITWQASTAAGVFLGAQAPANLGLDFALAATFIALLIPLLTDRPAALAALVGGGMALLAAGLPYKLGLVLAVVCGIVAGIAAERIGRARRLRRAGTAR